MRSLKVMIIKCDGRAGPYVMIDIETYFQALGHETCTADLRSMRHLPQSEITIKMVKIVRECLREFIPDMVIAYGSNNIISFHLGDGAPIDLFTFMEIPSVSVFYDSPLDHRVFDSSFNSWNPNYHYFFIWDQHYTEEMKKLGMNKSFFMPIGSNTKRFKKLKYDSADEERYGADVSFVGSYTPKREIVIRTLLDSGFTPVIWGYEWEKAGDKRIRGLIRGVADNEKDLVKVYNYSKVNINLTVDQGITSLNMRVFDCMASGGFLISDYKTDFDRLFDVENEVVTYKTVDELPALVRYYLDHEDARLEKAKNARRKVLAEHSYLNRVNYMVETMEDNGAFSPPYWWEKHSDPGRIIDKLLELTLGVREEYEIPNNMAEVAPA